MPKRSKREVSAIISNRIKPHTSIFANTIIMMIFACQFFSFDAVVDIVVVVGGGGAAIIAYCQRSPRELFDFFYDAYLPLYIPSIVRNILRTHSHKMRYSNYK